MMLMEQRTNMPAMTQLPTGSLRQSRPSSPGKLNMIYSSVMKPGASIVNQPILPGRLKRDSTDVLPMPYQLVSHCRPVNYTQCKLQSIILQ